jgi:hypothetical protein
MPMASRQMIPSILDTGSEISSRSKVIGTPIMNRRSATSKYEKLSPCMYFP